MPFTPFYVRVILDPQTVNITVDLALRTCDPPLFSVFSFECLLFCGSPEVNLDKRERQVARCSVFQKMSL
jgi:hypothetical protein